MRRFLTDGSFLVHIALPPVGTNYPQLSFKRHLALQKLKIGLPGRASAEGPAKWLSETLSTITSKAFTKLIISVVITSFSSYAARDNQARGFHSVDNVLDQLSLCEDVTLVASPPQHWVLEGRLKELVENLFPSMWKNGRVVVENPPPK